jgi:hypothetical protein
MMKPIDEMFQLLLKAQFKLMLLIMLSNAEDLKEFLKKPEFLSVDKVDRKYLAKLASEYSGVLEKFRRQLFQLEPDLFKPVEMDEPTKTMWRGMALLRITESV